MMVILDGIAWGLILAGIFFVLTGALGLIRLPDLFTRLHAAGMTDSMGAGLMITGMAVVVVKGMLEGEGGLWTVLVRLGLIYGFLLLTSPIGSHALSRAALERRTVPWQRGVSPSEKE